MVREVCMRSTSPPFYPFCSLLPDPGTADFCKGVGGGGGVNPITG